VAGYSFFFFFFFSSFVLFFFFFFMQRGIEIISIICDTWLVAIETGVGILRLVT
jgi:hypothetical protein